MSNVVIVTQHPAYVDYLIEQGIIDKNNIPEVVQQAESHHVLNKHVIGILPHRLSCLTLTYTELNLVVPPELVGQELTVSQLRKHTHGMDTYGVNRITGGWRVPMKVGKSTIPALLDRR